MEGLLHLHVARRSRQANDGWCFVRVTVPGFAQSGSSAPGSMRGDVFTKGTSGEPAVVPGARIVLRGPIGLYAALAVEVSAGTSSTVPVDMNVAAVTSTTSPQLTGLKAMHCAFSRKVHHA